MRPERVIVYHKAVSLFSSSYYHGSQSEFPVGFVLTPQPGGYAMLDEEDIAEVEAILEQYRPPEKIARRDAVYMVRDPDEIDSAGGYIDFIYTVIPVGEVEVSDMGWYSELSVYYFDMPKDEKQRLAEGYWSGKPFSRDKGSLFEYRARSAEIVAVEVNG